MEPDWIVKLGVLKQLKSVAGSPICGNQLPNDGSICGYYLQIDDYCYEFDCSGSATISTSSSRSPTEWAGGGDVASRDDADRLRERERCAWCTRGTSVVPLRSKRAGGGTAVVYLARYLARNSVCMRASRRLLFPSVGASGVSARAAPRRTNKPTILQIAHAYGRRVRHYPLDPMMSEHHAPNLLDHAGREAFDAHGCGLCCFGACGAFGSAVLIWRARLRGGAAAA